MKTKVLTMLLLIGCLLLCKDPTEVLADAAKVSVLTGRVEIVDAMAYELPMLMVGEDISELAMPANLECVVEGAAPWDSYFCPVVWENLDDIDTTTPGRVTITGTLKPEEGYVLADTFSPEVSYSALIMEEGMEKEILNEVECSGGKRMLAVGGDISSLKFEKRKAVCYTSNYGEYFQCPVAWDLSAINVNEPGTYIISGVIDLPAGFAMPEGQTVVTERIGVAPEDELNLSAILVADRSQVMCQWLKEIDPTKVIMEYAVDEEPWTVDPCWDDNGGGYYGYVWERMFVVHSGDLEENRDYYFRLNVDGVYSHCLHIKVTPDEVFAEGGVERPEPNEVETVITSGDDKTTTKHETNEKTEIESPKLPEPMLGEKKDIRIENYSDENVTERIIKSETKSTEDKSVKSLETALIEVASVEVAAAKVDSVKAEPIKAASIKVEPVKVDSIKTEPVKNESVKTAPIKNEPVNMDSKETKTKMPSTVTFKIAAVFRGILAAMLFVYLLFLFGWTIMKNKSRNWEETPVSD